MERSIEKTRKNFPSFFESGWMENFLNAPLDEFFNFGRVMNVPAVNVSETDKIFKLTIAAPGLEKSDFKVETTDDMLTISAEKEEKFEKNGRFNRREYNYSSWSRSFTLPEFCDFSKIDAEYKNGELMIAIPKTEMKEPKKLKSIPVS